MARIMPRHEAGPRLPEGLLEARFRVSRHYELLSVDTLSPEDRKRIGATGDTPDFHALLVPRPGRGMGAKAVDRRTASMLQGLRTPQTLAAKLEQLLGPAGAREALRLVLDGILEVEWAGAFVSGPAAYPLLLGDPPPLSETGALATRSTAALRHAATLPVQGPRGLAWRLYRYNSLPASPRLWRRFPTEAAVAAYVAGGLSGSGINGLIEYRSWLWSPTKLERRRTGSKGPTYKLYVSPSIDDLPGCVAAVAGARAATESFEYKVGRDLMGIVRPDKLVLYFKSLEGMEAVAADLTNALAGVESQGVPFTASLTPDGLLSWGVEPIRDRAWKNWPRGRSWRTWVTDRLAAAILAARAHLLDPTLAARFALGRVWLDGVDPASWAPLDSSTAS